MQGYAPTDILRCKENPFDSTYGVYADSALNVCVRQAHDETAWRSTSGKKADDDFLIHFDAVPTDTKRTECS